MSTFGKFSLLTGYQQTNSNLSKDNDEEEIKKMLEILQHELSTYNPNPTMDGLYLDKEFMLKLNKVSHKF